MPESFRRRHAVIVEIPSGITPSYLQPSFARASIALRETMKLNTLKDLYIHELKDLYSAEKQIIKALPKMIKSATNQELAGGFQEHLEQTREHAERLEKILSGFKQTTRGKKCKGMEGLLAEGSEMMEEEADEEVHDAGLIAAAQRVEHYEISGYGTARTYASLLGDKEGAKLLEPHRMRRPRLIKSLPPWPHPRST